MKSPNLSKKIVSIYIKSTLKNTIITGINPKTNSLLFQFSSQSYPINTKKKNNIYILQKLCNKIKLKFYELNFNTKSIVLLIYINGIGRGRFQVLKNLRQNFKIYSITDITPRPFNGCKVKKQKRK